MASQQQNNTTSSARSAPPPGYNETTGTNTTTNTTRTNPVNATIEEFKRKELGYSNLSAADKKKIRNSLTKIQNTDSDNVRRALMKGMVQDTSWQPNAERRKIIKKHLWGKAFEKVADNPVNATITAFKQQQLGYTNFSSKQQQAIQKNLQKLNQTGLGTTDSITIKQQRLIDTVTKPFEKTGNNGKAEAIVEKKFQIGTNLTHDGYGGAKKGVLARLLPNIPSLIEKKLGAVADAFVEGASSILTDIYDLAFSTPVPNNSGWANIFGTPTNQPYEDLYQGLLVQKLYPLTNLLLGMGVLVMGISLTVNPLVSRFRALDLVIKFVSFLLLYAFSWVAITLMHGAVNDIAMWLRPSEAALGDLVTNVGKMSAGAVAAYFAGSGGILATAFALGLELGLRQVALQYIFPYVFPVLLLLLYVSPWQRLKSYASVVIWQYVNVLTMIIPMAILLRAATLVEFSPGSGVKGMLALVALFLTTVSIPFISTYTFLQIPGKAGRGAKSAAVGAASRVGSAKDRLGWDGDDSSDSTAVGNTSPGDRTKDAVEASTDDTSSQTTSAEDALDDTDNEDAEETTAGQVRDLDEQNNRDPMNPEAMKQAYIEDHPRRSTLNQRLAD